MYLNSLELFSGALTLISVQVIVGTIVIASLTGCDPYWREMRRELHDDVGGGQDAISADLPFPAGYRTKCVQGAHGSYSHRGRATRFDVDLDTPNDQSDLVVAPASGVAYVHEEDPDHNFGRHVNVDLGDGTYLVLGHLQQTLVYSGQAVERGQILGVEGTTGNSTGDHVHLGRHRGQAREDAVFGESVEGLVLAMKDEAGEAIEALTSDMNCDLAHGEIYTSTLPVVQSHPDGTLVKEPSAPTVYRIEEGAARPFVNAEAFTSQGYEWDQVVIISPAEMACYDPGASINNGNDVEDQRADVRDGTLIHEEEGPLYVVSHGVGLELDGLEAYRLMGYDGAPIVEVPVGTLEDMVDSLGDCRLGVNCLDREAITQCHGTENMPGYDASKEEEEEEEDDTSEDNHEDEESDVGWLEVWWDSPEGDMDRITLSGEYSYEEGGRWSWRELAEVHGEDQIRIDFPDTMPGDSLRFSVEFERDDGDVSWSCLAPFPPGEIQGQARAWFDGTEIDVEAVADPTSDGCGLEIEVP